MKRLSIKLRITLYFTVIMAVLAGVQLLYTTSVSRRVAKNELYDTVASSVNALSERIHYKKPVADETPPPQGQNRPDGDKKPVGSTKPTSHFAIDEGVSYTDGDVLLAVFEVDDAYDAPRIYGSLPEGVSFDTVNTKVGGKSSFSTETDEYYLYSKYIRDPGNKNNGAWVVGSINAKLSSTLAHKTSRYATLSIPIIIILAALLGYAITKRAFRPVSEITATAAEIAGSNDLSRRINLNGNGKDEISRLANIFDGMLDTIQKNYEKEKQFTDDASHELRTPVAVILAQSELALNPNATDDDVKEAVEIINKQSLKMRKLLSELLGLARSDNNRTVLEKESFDLVELTEMIIDEEYSISQSKNISIRLLTKESVEVFADRTGIMRVLINFINNAIKYGKEGGFVEISVERVGENGARCKVRDNGIGISENDLPKIWDRFFRVDASRTDDGHSSTGLGLPMAKSIIEAHKGTVKAESVLGEGSVFEFTI